MDKNKIVNLFAGHSIFMGFATLLFGDISGAKTILTGLGVIGYMAAFAVGSLSKPKQSGESDDVSQAGAHTYASEEDMMGNRDKRDPEYMNRLYALYNEGDILYYNKGDILYQAGRTYCMIKKREDSDAYSIVKPVCDEGNTVVPENDLKLYFHEFLSDYFCVIEKAEKKTASDGDVSIEFTIANKHKPLNSFEIYADCYDMDGVVVRRASDSVNDLRPNTKYRLIINSFGKSFPRVTGIRIHSSEGSYIWTFD